MDINVIKVISIVILIMISNQTYAKSKCELEWNALKKIQSQLRHKSNEYLRNKEHQKHSEYQDCRKGKNQQSKKYKTTHTYQVPKKYYSNQYARNSFENSPVKMKTKFKGEKQIEWNKYYVRTKDCITPKTSTEFATCLNERDRKAKRFTELWDEHQNELLKKTTR